MASPAEIAASLNVEDRKVLKTVCRSDECTASILTGTQLEPLKLVTISPGSGKWSDFVLWCKVTDLGRAVAKELEKQNV